MDKRWHVRNASYLQPSVFASGGGIRNPQYNAFGAGMNPMLYPRKGATTNTNTQATLGQDTAGGEYQKPETKKAIKRRR